MKLSQFEKNHNLKLTVQERKGIPPNYPPFTAYFEGVYVVDGKTLTGVYGEGATAEEAQEEYAHQIAGATLRLPSAKDVKVPLTIEV